MILLTGLINILHALSAYFKVFMNFSDELKKWKEDLEFNQKDLSDYLYKVPNRTIQSWLLGEKEPPKYVQELVFYKLKNF